MTTWLGAGLMAASLALVSHTAAAGPLRLDDVQLDLVSAGALTSISATSRGQVGCCSGASTFTGITTDYFIGGGASDVDGNSGQASQKGTVRTLAGNNFSLTVGLVRGKTETTGNGTGTNTAEGVAEGDFTFTSGGINYTGSTNRQIGVIVALAIDNPFRSPQP